MHSTYPLFSHDDHHFGYQYILFRDTRSLLNVIISFHYSRAGITNAIDNRIDTLKWNQFMEHHTSSCSQSFWVLKKFTHFYHNLGKDYNRIKFYSPQRKYFIINSLEIYSSFVRNLYIFISPLLSLLEEFYI